jgi:hypothetical protein
MVKLVNSDTLLLLFVVKFPYVEVHFCFERLCLVASARWLSVQGGYTAHASLLLPLKVVNR